MTPTLLAQNVALVLGLMIVLWVISLVRRDASIVDPWWSMAFLLVTGHTASSSGLTPAKTLLLLMVAVWAIRLWLRLWTVHPRYLDSQGLTALWREALLAREVLLGRTRGYRHHPQLRRFQARSNSVALINAYLFHVHAEAHRRGFAFDRAKLGSPRARIRLPETVGQLEYEWHHLQAKLRGRSPAQARALRHVRRPDTHPLFRLVAGRVRPWEIRRAA